MNSVNNTMLQCYTLHYITDMKFTVLKYDSGKEPEIGREIFHDRFDMLDVHHVEQLNLELKKTEIHPSIVFIYVLENFTND